MKNLFDLNEAGEFSLREFKEIYEYLLILSPNDQVINAIRSFKKEFKEDFPEALSTGLKPHITLMNFINVERNEERIIKRFAIMSRGMRPLNVVVDGFCNLGQAIAAKVISKTLITKAAEDFKARNADIFRPNYTRYCTNPHLTIARQIPVKHQKEAWQIWKDKKYSVQFEIKEMILLKRKLGGGKCEVIGTFQFTGKTIFEQMELNF